jgi:signal transduction histidine kinase
MAGFTLNLALLIILIRRSNRSNSVLWFALFIVFGLLWSAAETMERLSANPIGAAYWGDLISGVTTFMPAYFYMFVRSYTSKAKTPVSIWVPIIIIGTAGMMGSLLAGNNVFKIPVASNQEPWGYLTPNSIVSVLFIGWAVLFTFAAIGRLIAFYRKSISRNERRLAVIFMVSAAGVIVVSAITEVILPYININTVPPLGVFSNALLALGVIIGIIKYGSFSVGAGEIADIVLATMHDGVIVTNLSYQIIYRNSKAQNLLAGLGRDLIGVNLQAAYGERFEPARLKWEHDLASAGYADTDDIEVGTPSKRVTVNMQVSPMSIEHPGYIIVLVDVTKARDSTDTLKKQAAELEITNKAFQDSQAAMVNLLEDARDLEIDLKREKAGVEQKVLVRTEELQSERESLKAIINGVNFGIYILNPQLHIELVNKQMQELYAQAYDKPYSLEAFNADVQHREDSQTDIHQALKTRQPVARAEFVRGNRILRSFRSPIFESNSKDAKLLQIVNVIQDITETKSAERSRDEFFSIASHELRTPLTAIRGNTSMIQQYFGDQLKDPSLKEMISDIYDSSTRLINIVNDFLNTSRLEQGKMEFKPAAFDLPNLVNEVIEEFRAGNVAGKVPIVTHLGAVPEAMADRDRLKEVIINLISNAIKFTEDGTITVNLETENEWLKLSVTDTGRGIPKESQGLLFRKFQQASNNILTRDSTRSTGLGLYISKLIMAGIGGEIFLEKSTIDKGATFTILISAVKPSIPPKQAKPKPVLSRVKS